MCFLLASSSSSRPASDSSEPEAEDWDSEEVLRLELICNYNNKILSDLIVPSACRM